MMTAIEKLAMIESALAQGRTVYLSTATRATKLTAKVAAKWTAIGRPVVKVKGTSLYLANGKSYVCADYCAISIA